MDNLTPVRSFLQDLITPIVTEAVRAAMPKADNPSSKEYLSVGEAMEQFSLSSSTIYRRFEDGTFTKVKNGGRTLIRRSEIEESMEEKPLCVMDQPKGRGRKGRK